MENTGNMTYIHIYIYLYLFYIYIYIYLFIFIYNSLAQEFWLKLKLCRIAVAIFIICVTSCDLLHVDVRCTMLLVQECSQTFSGQTHCHSSQQDFVNELIEYYLSHSIRSHWVLRLFLELWMAGGISNGRLLRGKATGRAGLGQSA